MMSAQAVPDWKGSFSPVVLADVLKRVAREGRSGHLQIVSGNWIKTLGIGEGTICSARSNMRNDRLGESMLAQESISKNDFEAASERMMNEGCRFGEALLQIGAVNRDQLHRELAVQAQRIVLSLFRVSDGMYAFDETGSDERSMPYSLSVPALLLRGLQRIEDGRIILDALPHASTRVRLARIPPFPVEDCKLGKTERSVLDRAADGGTLASIVRDPKLPRAAALRSCFALLNLGMLEVVPEPPVSYESEEEVRARVESRHAALVDVSEEELLGVSRSVSEEELKVAYEQLCEDWSAVRDRLEEMEDQGLLEKLGAIEFRFAAAYHQMLVERTRSEEPGSDSAQAEEVEDASRDPRAVQLERDARIHLEVDDYTGALGLLTELVTMEPTLARHQVSLGRAMELHPTLGEHAEERYLRAVELAPEQAFVHAELGGFYERSRRTVAAQESFATALELDPDNEAARAFLSSGPEPTKVTRLFKKLFGADA